MMQISVTSGVVSRIEVTSYSHGSTELLSVQIDAAINSGNSGGPVFNETGQCVGIAFQSYAGTDAENIGWVSAGVAGSHATVAGGNGVELFALRTVPWPLQLGLSMPVACDPGAKPALRKSGLYHAPQHHMLSPMQVRHSHPRHPPLPARLPADRRLYWIPRAGHPVAEDGVGHAQVRPSAMPCPSGFVLWAGGVELGGGGYGMDESTWPRQRLHQCAGVPAPSSPVAAGMCMQPPRATHPSRPSLSRRAYGMRPDQKGVLIRDVLPLSGAAGVLHPDDILLRFEDTQIAADGTIAFRVNERIAFSAWVGPTGGTDVRPLRQRACCIAAALRSVDGGPHSCCCAALMQAS